MQLIDCHTHRAAPYREGIICLDTSRESPAALSLLPGQAYSAGPHPWTLDHSTLRGAIDRTAALAASPQVLAIGETGLDPLRGTLMATQLTALRAMASLAHELCKPLVIHTVRTLQEVVSLHRSFAPTVPWVLHAFRGRPSHLAMLPAEGFMLSFGPQFNPDTLAKALSSSPSLLLAETDDSGAAIEEVIRSMARHLPLSAEALASLIAVNTARTFGTI